MNLPTVNDALLENDTFSTAWRRALQWMRDKAETAVQPADIGTIATLNGSQGSWTPTITFATPGTSSVAYTTQTGTYARVGNVVTLNFQVTFTPTLGTASGALLIQGLPFTIAVLTTAAGAVASLNNAFTWPASRTMAVLGANDANSLIVVGLGSGVNPNSFTFAHVTSGSSHTIRGAVSYTTS